MEDDYAYEYVFKSESGQMLIHFVSQYQSIQIEFLYNLDNTEAEQWILQTNHDLRSTYGSQKLPGFKVLVASDGGFYTEDVTTVDFRAVDINEFYNDDFAEVDGIISQSMTRMRRHHSSSRRPRDRQNQLHQASDFQVSGEGFHFHPE